MHEFTNIISTYSTLIQKQLKTYLTSNAASISSLENRNYEKIHWQLCSDYPDRRSKYIRPILCMLTAEAMDLSHQKVIPTATALEICQNALLIHDDIEDNSEKRRGEPTLHLKYNMPLALNAGDSLHLIMWKILQDNEPIFGAEKTLRIMDEFYCMLLRTALGQTADLLDQIDCKQFDINEHDYFYIVDNKTSYYSIAGPMRLAAILAEGNGYHLTERVFPLLNKLGCYLGRVFQIVDDLLDVTSDFDGLKTVPGQDIYESKHTLLVNRLLQTASLTQRTKVLSILAKPRAEKTVDEVNEIIELMVTTGTLIYAREVASSFTKTACTLLDEIPFFTNSAARQKLYVCIDFLLNRKF